MTINEEDGLSKHRRRWDINKGVEKMLLMVEVTMKMWADVIYSTRNRTLVVMLVVRR